MIFFLSFSKATNDLENFDKERHEEFKRYEMTKEHERRERLKSLDDEQRKREEEHYEEMKKKHADHPKVNHPVRGWDWTHPEGRRPWSEIWCERSYECLFVCAQGSQDQLKEVWQEADGLDPDDFDPKTFFKLHGKVVR